MMKIKLYLSQLVKPPMSALLMVSLVAWLILLFSGDSMSAHTSGHHQQHGDDPAAQVLLQSASSWFLMLLAMMSPLLGNAIQHLWVRSLSRRRIRAIIFFIVPYIAVWMLVGAVLLAGTEQLKMLSRYGQFTLPIIALLIAFGWQASPWKQICLNRCHLLPRLSAFGLAADVDALRFGLVKGFWCVGTCWALMLLPLIFSAASLPVMLAISLYLFFEQYQPARPAQWRIPLVGKVFN